MRTRQNAYRILIRLTLLDEEIMWIEYSLGKEYIFLPCRTEADADRMMQRWEDEGWELVIVDEHYSRVYTASESKAWIFRRKRGG